jgi:2-polyprenyl-3-methyl-5-hydroxy-6-metoxy-1,4-benzoquinol methylase
MLEDIKKIKLNLKLLKPISDLKIVEKTFDIFINKNIRNNKIFFSKKFCCCGKKRIIFKKKIKLFYYNKCICGNIFVDKMLTDYGSKLIYEPRGPYDLYRNKFIKNKENKYTFKLRKKINIRKAAQASKFINKNSYVLDFGCGNQNFLKELSRLGYKKLFGTDINTKFNKSSKIVIKKNINEFKMKFNLITMWGVLEHVKNPLVLLKNLSLYLKKNGFILLETPNAESLLMQYIMEQNQSGQTILRFLEPARHLFFFSRNFFKSIEKKIKMKMISYETNGLDLQTIFSNTNDKVNKNILSIQSIIDQCKLSDHYRILLQKK